MLKDATAFFDNENQMSRSLIKLAAVIATAALSVAFPAGAGGDLSIEPKVSVVGLAVGAESSAVPSTENGELHSYKLMLAGLAAVAFVAVRRRRI